MTTHLQAKATLHNGVEMPWFGLGVFQVEEGSELVNAVKTAIVHECTAVLILQLSMEMKLALEKGFGKALKKQAFQERICLSHRKYGMRI
nr:hypothetical protein P5651_10400 [Bacillus subtilis]